MRRDSFSEEKFYHIYSRGIEKRTIYRESGDYVRFIHDLFEFNDKNITTNFGRIFYQKSYEGPPRTFIGQPREMLVEIICFCLMPNHFHLILKQLIDGGISKFMQKLGAGFALFFNEKYNRDGFLFQGPFKAVPIESDVQLTHTTRYIHLNPVELIEPGWKVNGVQDWEKVNAFLKKYRWSSYLDYIGIQNFPSITSCDFILEYFKIEGAYEGPRRAFIGPEKRYERFVQEWLIQDLDKIKELLIEK